VRKIRGFDVIGGFEGEALDISSWDR